MAILYFLGEEPVQNDQQQDCCLIVEVIDPDGIDSRWVQQAVENEIEEQFGKRLTLWSINEDEALHYLEAMPDATHGALQLATGVALFYHLARIV
jgi:hypothetical protein